MASVQSYRIFWTAAGLCGLLSAPAHAQEGAEALWSAMARCAAMTDEAARHGCADDALISVGLLTNADLAAQRVEAFGLPETKKAAKREAEKPARAETAAAPAPVVEKPKETAAPGVGENEITVTIAAVDFVRGKRAVLTTEEGAVWRQTDGGALRPSPKPGQAMSVERTGFGGYRCKIGKWTAFRCERDA